MVARKLEYLGKWMALQSRTKLALFTMLFFLGIGLYCSAGFHYTELDQAARTAEKAETVEQLFITRNAVPASDRLYLEPFGNNTRGKIDYTINLVFWPVAYIAWPAAYYAIYYTVGGHFFDLIGYTVALW